jgi:hypothetical protein
VGGGLDLIEVVDGDLREHGDPVATQPGLPPVRHAVLHDRALVGARAVHHIDTGRSAPQPVGDRRDGQAGQGGGLAPSSVTSTTVVAPNSSGPLPTTTVTSVTLPTGLPSTTLPDGPGGNGLGYQRGCRSGA